MEENKVYNPKELEYWRNIFPTKTDSELEEYRVRWSKENPDYLKFKKFIMKELLQEFRVWNTDWLTFKLFLTSLSVPM